MNDNKVSHLLEILDLDYLKPILVDRFATIGELSVVDLQELGVQNPNDLAKLRYALDQLEESPEALNQFDPILSLHESDHILTRLENETNLISSGLHLLLEQTNRNLPKDDATSDIDYQLYNQTIDQIETDIEHLKANTNQLIEKIELQFPQVKRPTAAERRSSFLYSKGTLLFISTSVFCLAYMFLIKRK